MRSGSTSCGAGFGPMPSSPFSLWNTISRPGGMWSDTIVGRPMPRFTYQPLSMSWAARQAICGRESGVIDGLLNEHDAVDEYAGSMHAFRIDVAQLDHLLGLHHGQLRRHRHHRIEVARRLAVREVAPAIGAVRAQQRHVAAQRLFEYVALAVDLAHLLAVGELGADADGRIEAAEPGGSGAHALADDALRHQLEFDAAGLVGGIERARIVGARERADHLAHEARIDQRGEPALAAAGVVRHHDEIAHAQFEQPVEQLVGRAHGAEAGGEDRRAIANAFERRGDAGDLFIDHGEANSEFLIPDRWFASKWRAERKGQTCKIELYPLAAAFASSGRSTGPPAFFQPPKPPRMWATGLSPMRWAACAASAERQPPAQKNTNRLSCANTGL